jgi:hypothetical protein
MGQGNDGRRLHPRHRAPASAGERQQQRHWRETEKHGGSLDQVEGAEVGRRSSHPTRGASHKTDDMAMVSGSLCPPQASLSRELQTTATTRYPQRTCRSDGPSVPYLYLSNVCGTDPAHITTERFAHLVFYFEGSMAPCDCISASIATESIPEGGLCLVRLQQPSVGASYAVRLWHS